MKKFFNSQFWLVIVSIIFSILLFLTATTSNYTHVGSQVSGATETFTHTLTNAIVISILSVVILMKQKFI